MIGRAGQWTPIPSTTCLQPKNEMLIFGLRSTSGDQLGWLMEFNPICHPSPAKKMKCLLLYYVIVQIISRAGRWTQSPSTTPQAKKWNANFCITFNSWWLARLVIGLEPHPPPVSSQKKWNAHFWITFNFWWSAGLVDELESHLPPLSSQKNEVLIFRLCSTSDDWPGWSMDSNPICHLSPAKEWNANFGLCSTSDDQLGWSMDSNPICYPSPNKKMICSFLDYVQLLMIGWAGQWTRTLSAIPLQTKKWYAHFCITFKFWSLAGLVNGFEPHLQPLSSQKSEMLIFGLRSTSDDWPGWSMDSNPICHLSPGIKWNAHFCIMFNFWWLAGLVDGLEPHLPPLSSQKMKCSFLYYIQLLMIGQAGHWTRTPSTSCLKPKKMKCSFLDYV